MFNLNIPPSSLLGIDGAIGLCHTPKTPEIVNSLIAMTNPLDSYQYVTTSSSTASTPGSIVTVRNFNAATNSQAISQDSSHSSCSGSPLDSPVGTNTTPSVQQTCSQLIKAGLKLSIQSKRKLSTCESSSGSEQANSKCSRRDDECDDTSDDDDCDMKSIKGLTPEDEDRRRRRRERNKIAATKCRMKKRERTQNLIKESEQLDTQNVDLKNQVRTLEKERRQLFDMLQSHSLGCRRGGFNPPTKLLQSPAIKYLAELELESIGTAGVATTATSVGRRTPNSQPQQQQQQQQQLQRTAIPPMSTIKFSRSNGFKAAGVVAAAVAGSCNSVNHLQQQHNHQHQTTNSTTSIINNNNDDDLLPNGYCKLSPTTVELGYLTSPSHDNAASVCLQSLPIHSAAQHQHQQQQQQPQQACNTINNNNHPTAHHLSDYIPNCESSLSLSLSLAASTPTTTITPTSNEDTETLLGVITSVATSPLMTSAVANVAPTTARDFVKNELVDSESPYTTAQSAERFLFESNCEHFIDIKHAINISNNNNNSSSLNHNHSIVDFHTSSIMCATPIGPFHDHISIKNDFLSVHETDLLSQLVAEGADGSEFVDLDTGVAAAFSQISNGGCLA